MPKTCQFVLSAARRLPLAQVSIRPERAGLTLHAMVVNVGHEDRKPGEVYDWSGEARGPAEWALLQLTLAGRGHLEYEGRMFTSMPGHAMLLTLPHAHRYWRDGNDRWKFLYVCLTGHEIVRIWRHVIARRGPVLALSSTAPLIAMSADVVRKGLNHRLNDPTTCSAMAYQLAMAVLAYESLSGLDAGAPRHRPHAVAAAIDFARRHYAEPIGVEDMAEAARLSRFHFTRLFQQHIGQPPGEFLRKERLRAVTRLLQSTDLSLKTIAQQTGLPNAEYLSRVFRKAHGVSPRNYREACRR